MKHIISILFCIIIGANICANNYDYIDYGDSSDIIISIDTLAWRTASLKDSIPTLSMAQSVSMFKKGYPDLPVVYQNIQLFSDSILHYKILESKTYTIVANISPSAGFTSFNNKDALPTKGAIYQSNDYYPSKSINTTLPYIQRQIRSQGLKITPLQYNAAQKSLRVHSYLHIRVYHPRLVLKSSIIKPPKETMLIVATSEFDLALKPFILWKEQCGINVQSICADTIPNTTALRNIISKQYWDNKISYVLIVGDAEHILPSSTHYGVSDNAFGYIDGEDHFLDVYVGRFPASTVGELERMIIKSINYEKQESFDTNLLKAFGVASQELTIGDNGETDFEHTNELLNSLKESGFMTEIISPIKENNKAISELINSNVGIMTYAGHGNTTTMKTEYFNIDSLDHLHNTTTHPLFIDVACYNGLFTANDCLAEEMLLCTYKGEPTGMVGVLASTIEQPWIPPMFGQDEIINAIIESANNKKPKAIGQIIAESLARMIIRYQEGGIETADTWTLFGDPSLRVWSYSPDSISVTVDSVFDVRSNELTITGPDSAYVSMTANDQLLATERIYNNQATLLVASVSVTDSINITTTRPGFLTNITRIAPMFHGGAYYGLDSLILEGDKQVVEAGELIRLTPLIKNYGDSLGINVAAHIVSSHSSFLSVCPTVQLGNINADSTQSPKSSFQLLINNDVPNGTVEEILIDIIDETGQRNTYIHPIHIYTPIINFDLLSINNSQVQNNEYVFQDSIIEVKILCNNSGGADAKNITAALVCKSPYVQYISQFDTLSSVTKHNEDTISFSLLINKNISKGERLNINVHMTSVYCTDTISISITAHQQPNIVIGDGNLQLEDCPFFNYYKYNRSQFLYELNNDIDIQVDKLALYIMDAPHSDYFTQFSNLKISIGFTSDSMLNYSFIDNVTPVYEEIITTLSRNEGWCTFDVEDFCIPSHSNMIIEISWGLNKSCTPYGQSYTVSAHRTSYITTVTGYHDQQFPTSVRNGEKAVPDLRIIKKLEEVSDVTISIEDSHGNTLNNHSVRIGSMNYLQDNSGMINLQLPKGDYTASIYKDDNIIKKEILSVKSINEKKIFTIGSSASSILSNPYPSVKFWIKDQILYINNPVQGDFLLEVYTMTGVKVKTIYVSEGKTSTPLITSNHICILRINKHYCYKVLSQ